jgi:sec-independent protein translocase protein TatC
LVFLDSFTLADLLSALSAGPDASLVLMHKPLEDDLFRHSTMTFGEHLEELRRRLFRALFWLGIGLLIGLGIGRQVVHFIETPLTNALTKYFADIAEARIKADHGDNLPPGDAALMADGYVPEEVYYEPSRLLDSLGRGNPAAVQAIPRSPVYRISAADLVRPKLLADNLHAAAKDETSLSPARRVWEKLKPRERAVVDEIATSDVENPTAVQTARLTDALNRLIGDPELYAETYFTNVLLSDDLAKLVTDRAKLTPEQIRQMNWLLLPAAFPDLVAARNPNLAPLTIWRLASQDERIKPKTMSATEAFVIYMKAALLSGLILFSPLIFREIWLFVAAGLYPHERRYVYIFLPFSVALFISGALLAFFAAFPPVLKFLFSFNEWLGFEPETRISEWLSLVLFLPLAFGIGFQLPLVMLFINRIGLVSVAGYWRSWRVAVLVIFILAPILNPSPDPYSMMLMAAPMTLLYFGGILLCQYASRRQPKGIGGE